MGSTASQRKIPKWLPFKNYKPELLNILCAYIRDTDVCVDLYMKPLCLIMWQGEVCTDDDADANDDTDVNDDANEDNDTRETKHDCTTLFGW